MHVLLVTVIGAVFVQGHVVSSNGENGGGEDVPILPPTAEAVIMQGSIRIQALSPTLFRIEAKGPNGGFEDRTTFLAVNRSWPGVEVSVTEDDDGVNVSTATVVVRVSKNPYPKPPKGSCIFNNDTKLTGFARSANYCNGTIVSSAAECCKACSGDNLCVGFMYTGQHSADFPFETIESAFHNNSVGAFRQPDPSVEDPPVPRCKSGGNPPHTNCYPMGIFSGFQKNSPGVTSGCPSRDTSAACGGGSDPGFGHDVTLHDKATGALLTRLKATSGGSSLPSPSDTTLTWTLQDTPRFYAPPWGATPPPATAKIPPALANYSGYDPTNDAPDYYVFVMAHYGPTAARPVHEHPGSSVPHPGPRGWSTADAYKALRREFLLLTGHTPLIPDYAFGTWFTWWHNYTQSEAEGEIKRWIHDKLPLDTWGMDMNWRDNCSLVHKPQGGYAWKDNCMNASQVNRDHFYNYTTNLFPNMAEFIAFEHKHNIKSYFNDHPFPVGPQTSPEEISFRWEGLTSVLKNIGIDWWWLDTNWRFSIPGAFGLDNIVWGGHLYSTVQARFNAENGRTDERAMVLHMSSSTHPAHHRFPVWWTGDDKGLSYSVSSMVDLAVTDVKPYVHSDCGSDARTDNVSYLRWIQHCAMGSILRIHGGPPDYPSHQPWSYDTATEDIFRTFVGMRYKLMPTLVAAGHTATEDGTPLVRRLDLEFPDFPPASNNDQYLLTDDILVAPLGTGTNAHTYPNGTMTRDVWIPPGDWQDPFGGNIISGNGSAMRSVTRPIDQMALWYRHGGLIVCVQETTSTSVQAQDWSRLVVEAFPRTTGAGRTSIDTRRSVYQKQYEHHMPARTDVRMTGSVATDNGTDTSSSLLFTISNVYDSVAAIPSNRSWVFRVHLAPHEVVRAVTVNGAPVRTIPADRGRPHGNVGEAFSAYARVLESMNSVANTIVGVTPPIGGVGTPPPARGGSIVEVLLSEAHGDGQVQSTPLTIEIKSRLFPRRVLP
eukprot:m.877901 g.877901  ORF g.877901 m.877901 type:complete len:992 (-) comp23584_c0_seq4:210-3185(-)